MNVTITNDYCKGELRVRIYHIAHYLQSISALLKLMVVIWSRYLHVSIMVLYVNCLWPCGYYTFTILLVNWINYTLTIKSISNQTKWLLCTSHATYPTRFPTDIPFSISPAKMLKILLLVVRMIQQIMIPMNFITIVVVIRFLLVMISINWNECFPSNLFKVTRNKSVYEAEKWRNSSVLNLNGF